MLLSLLCLWYCSRVFYPFVRLHETRSHDSAVIVRVEVLLFLNLDRYVLLLVTLGIVRSVSVLLAPVRVFKGIECLL